MCTMSPWSRFVDRVASKFAFFPPSPPSYVVKQHNDGTGELYIDPIDKSYPKVLSAVVRRIQTQPRPDGGGGTEIITAFVPYGDGRGGRQRARATLLYSHGNAVDLGQMLPIYRELGKQLVVNVMGYDYTGYGCSSGQPSVSSTLADVEAVLGAAQEVHGVATGDVVLYGQSVGSGPTCWLAAQEPRVAGVVLHAPLLSGVRVLNPGLRFWPTWLDVFPNHVLVQRIKAPLLVMHGTDDEVIHISAGRRLWELAPVRSHPLFAVGFGHQNLEVCSEYIPRLRQFLHELFPADYRG